MAMNMPLFCWKRCRTISTGKPHPQCSDCSVDWLVCSSPAPTTSSAAEIPLSGNNGRRSKKRNRLVVSAPVVMNMTTTRGRPCNHYRRTTPFGIVRRHLTKRNKQLKSSATGNYLPLWSQHYLNAHNCHKMLWFFESRTRSI